MTTVACDGRTMAADGLVTEDDHICRTDYRKVFELADGRIAGFAGNCYNWGAFAGWLDNGGDLPKVEDGFCCIVLSQNGDLHSYDQHGRIFPECAPKAIGSGALFALAAMDFGQSAAEAVGYACTRDIYSGGSITVAQCKGALRDAA